VVDLVGHTIGKRRSVNNSEVSQNW
jgi:hypothetical protein